MNDIQITEIFNRHLHSLEWDEKDPIQIAMYLRLHDAFKSMFKNTTIIDWEIDDCIEELKGDWMSVALTGRDNLGNIYNGCGETFISSPSVENITDIQCEGQEHQNIHCPHCKKELDEINLVTRECMYCEETIFKGDEIVLCKSCTE